MRGSELLFTFLAMNLKPSLPQPLRFALLAVLFLALPPGCSGPAPERISVDLPEGGRLVNRIEAADGTWNNTYIYAPADGSEEEITGIAGEADRELRAFSGSSLGNPAATDEVRPTEIVEHSGTLVFRPRVQASTPGERILIRTNPGSWVERPLVAAYEKHPILLNELRTLDGNLDETPRIVDIDLYSSQITARVSWGFQPRQLDFAFGGNGTLDLIRVTELTADESESAEWTARGPGWNPEAMFKRSRKIFMSAKERQLLSQAVMTAEGAKVGTYVTEELLNELFATQRQLKTIVLKDTRIVNARDCENDDDDHFRVCFAGELLSHSLDREPFAECWRFILRGDDWVGAAIELTDPTLDAIADLKRSDTPESACVTLR